MLLIITPLFKEMNIFLTKKERCMFFVFFFASRAGPILNIDIKCSLPSAPQLSSYWQDSRGARDGMWDGWSAPPPAAAPLWRTFLQMQEGEIMHLTRRARGVKCARGDTSNYGVRQSVRRFWFWNALFRTNQGVGVVNCCWQFLSLSSIFIYRSIYILFAML